MEKRNSSAYNRDVSRRKALRKRRIAEEVYYGGKEHPYYDNLHQYSKNKIHCSCPMCSCKTNTKIYKSRGPVGSHDMRQTISCKRYGKKNYKVSEIRKIDRLNYVEEQCDRGETE